MRTLAILLLLTTVVSAVAGPGDAYYNYTADLHRDCIRSGLDQHSMFGAPLCETLGLGSSFGDVAPITKAEALKKGMWYRAIGWGKHFPADEDGYFLPASGEFIPKSWALPSPDGIFHRCTYPLNEYWSGPPENKWKVLHHSDTLDGKPPTRCFWHPSR